MDSKYKSLLEYHRQFLSKNIIWSAELSAMLKERGLVTDFMIRDINSRQSREDKVHVLIDLIPLKSSSAFQKFLDVLILSGHVFISDFLQEDEDQQKLFDVKTMYKALPFVQRAFNDTEKKAIETFMKEQIENQVLKLLWKRDNREKDKALEAKMKQVEQSYEYQEHVKDKAAAISSLEKEISASLENKEELKSKLAALTAAHRDMEAKHKEAMEIQMRYNAANDSSIEKSKQTISGLEDLIQTLHATMDEELKRNVKDFPVNFDQSGSIKRDRENRSKSKGIAQNGEAGESDPKLVYKNKFGFVLGDLESLISRYRFLLDVKIRHDRLLDEKEYILIHFGYPQREAGRMNHGGGVFNNSEQEPSMVDAYKDFAARNDENMNLMKKQIEEYDGILEKNKAKIHDLSKEKDETVNKLSRGTNVWQGAIMNVMRKQLQDLKTEGRKKESIMTMQEEEMNKLRNRISELESRVSALNVAQPETLSVSQGRDLVDGRLSAVSPDSVELIPSETPKPSRNKNLPPLKQSSKPPNPSKVGSTSPRGTVMRSSKSFGLPPKTVAMEASKNYITFPIGPISSQIKPDVRGRPMGSVLGDLKAMNKHHPKPLLDNPRSAWKQNGNISVIK